MTKAISGNDFKVVVVGLGQIGLPTALSIAAAGHDVVGVDSSANRIAELTSGLFDTSEPDLIKNLGEQLDSGRFRVRADHVSAEIYIVAVPTPVGHDGTPDLSAIENAALGISGVLEPGQSVVLESTVPPGTTSGIFVECLERNSGLKVGFDFNVAHCPERVMPGRIFAELRNNSRVVGVHGSSSEDNIVDLYGSFVHGHISVTDPETAETAKLLENIYRDVNIALANELSLLTHLTSTDIHEAIELANSHQRVNIHWPGVGVGGYCIPIASHLLFNGKLPNDGIMGLSRKVNESMPAEIVKLILNEIPTKGGSNQVAILGVSYKPDVGDARHSPAMNIIERLESAGITVKAYDPLVTKFERLLHSLDEAIANSDVILIATGHSEFSKLSVESIAGKMSAKVVVDGPGVLDPDVWKAAGFKYIRIGSVQGLRSTDLSK
jgi:UDP-N-acetyl-D-mannosaminuronic acid dehydrogenase